MKYCKECGNEYVDTDKFCGKCGAELSVKLPAEEPETDGLAVLKTEVKKQAAKKATASSEKPKTVTVKPNNKKEMTLNKNKCPSCGSRNLRVEEKPFRKSMLLLGVVGVAIEANRKKGKQFVCNECGEKWDKN
jgi:predicted RNA-binding Zn-ribbon protein involved in translation (DUF1610 family)